MNYINNCIDPDDQYDTQSDDYSFNFNGYSGTFYLDDNRKPILNNASPLKIIKNPPAPYSDYEFIIKDPFGVIYCFGNLNSTEKTKYLQMGGGHSIPGFYMPTSWFLSKIENGFEDEINLSYTLNNIIYDAALSQSVTRRSDQNPSGVGENLIITRAYLHSIKLDNISTRTENINFRYSPSICAFQGDFNKLDEIEISSGNVPISKKFFLEYDIITSTLQNLKNPHIDYRDCYGKRLLLRSVTEYGSGLDFKKPYLFSYYSSDQIPPRFSYAQDYWGYYNGIKTNKYLVSDGDYYFLHESNGALLEGLFHEVGGNKKPNGNFGKNGLLKKVIYPSGGYNELFYEPHSYYGTKIIPPPKKVISLTPNTVTVNCSRPTTEQKTKTATTGPIPFTHSNLLYPDIFNEAKVPITVSASFDQFCYENECNGDPTHGNFAILSIKDHNDPNRQIKIYKRTQDGRFFDEGSEYSVYPENGVETVYIDLEVGITYDIRYYISSINSRCTSAYMSFEYYKEPFTEVETNIEVGGSRIEKIISDDGNGIPEIKKYHYGNKDCMDCSSGISEKPIPSIAYSKLYYITPYVLQCGGCAHIHDVDELTLTSSNLYNLYGRKGHQIGYSSVIEEYGNDFQGGGVLHRFQITPDTGPHKERDSWPVPGTPFDKNFGTGNELETEVFLKSNNVFKKIKNTINHYVDNPSLDRETLYFNIRLRDIYGFGIGVPIEQQINSFDISSYYQRSKFQYMDSSVTTDYDENENPIAITTWRYGYGNPIHLQPTRVAITRAGDDKELITKTEYPDDLPGEPYMDNLNWDGQHRIAEPIRVRSYQKVGTGPEQLLSTKKTDYGNFGGLFLPKAVQTSKETYNLETRLLFHSYDAHGNLREVSQPNGSRTVYVMGYNFTLPVAKLENVSLSEINQSWLNEIYNAANEEALLTALANLRANITNLNTAALVTTLTYKPLVGVHTITDPKNYMMTYEYDDFGRLKYVKDMEGNVLSENQYHYKND